MNALLSLLIVPSLSPVTATMSGESPGEVVLLHLERGVVKVVAQGNLGLQDSNVLTMASDGRQVVVLTKHDFATALWLYSATKGKIRRIGRLRAPRQVAALAMTRGRCLAGTLLGQVFQVLPRTPILRERVGNIARSTAELKLSKDGEGYALRIEYGGFGDTLDTSVFAGTCAAGRSIVENTHVSSEPSSPFTDATYVAQKREIWTFDGSGVADVSRGLEAMAAGHDASRNRQAKAVRAVRLSRGGWIVGDSDGRLSFGRFARGVWAPKGESAKLPDPVGRGTYFREAHGEDALIVANSGSSTMWWVPILKGNLGLGKPRRIYENDGLRLVSLSH